jgi:pimeloyl-ACP methyl ester carboxylesterase
MREEAVVLGDGLSGVFTAPVAPVRRTAFLFLNAGFLHRVGPKRLHVKVARALAEAGFPALRFDFSGLGESDARPDGMPYEERTIKETQAGMEALRRYGAERFVLFGLCAGADAAMRIGLADPRVVGGILVQPYSFGSRGYWTECYTRRLITAEFWSRLLRGRIDFSSARQNLRKRPRRNQDSDVPADDVSSFWKMPPPNVIVSGLRALRERGVRLLLLYSRPSPAEYNYRTIMKRALEAMGAGPQVEVGVYDRTDHTFGPLSHQARVVRRIVDWAVRLEGDGEPVPE